MCQSGWEGLLGENGYTYMYGWVSLLFTWNYHNIVNRLYPNIKSLKYGGEIKVYVTKKWKKKKSPRNAEDIASIPGQGTKIPRATKKQACALQLTEPAPSGAHDLQLASRCTRRKDLLWHNKYPTRLNEDSIQPDEQINIFLNVGSMCW